MSSGLRKLNFTKRVRIDQGDIDLRISKTGDGGVPSLSVTVNLSRYRLPSDACVMLEAHRQTGWQRFDLGTVASPAIPHDCSLRDFGSGEGVQFRLKVVELATKAGGMARILAHADGIRAQVDGGTMSMLPIEPDPALVEEVWRLEVADGSDPVVRVSAELVRDRHGFARSPAFLTLCMPNILREILEWAVDETIADEDDEMSARGRWIRFGCDLLNQPNLPNVCKDPALGQEARQQWVEDVVSRFCRKHQVDRKFSQWWLDRSSGNGGQLS